MKIGALAAATGVTRQAIHYYLREGILAPPVSSSRNMAYYDQRHVEELHLIRELQNTRYLPLAVIKLTLEARRQGGDLHQSDHLDMMQKFFTLNGRTGEPDSEQRLSRTDLLIESGLTPEGLDALFSAGLLEQPSPVSGDDNLDFDRYDRALARNAGVLIALGWEPGDLGLLGRLLKLMTEEVRLVHDRIIHKDGLRHASLSDIERTLTQIHDLIVARAYQDFLMNHDWQVNRRGGPAHA